MSIRCLTVSSLARGGDAYINICAELVPKCPVPKPQESLTGPLHGISHGGFSGCPSHSVPHTVPDTVPQRNPRMGSHGVSQGVPQEITHGVTPPARPVEPSGCSSPGSLTGSLTGRPGGRGVPQGGPHAPAGGAPLLPPLPPARRAPRKGRGRSHVKEKGRGGLSPPRARCSRGHREGAGSRGGRRRRWMGARWRCVRGSGRGCARPRRVTSRGAEKRPRARVEEEEEEGEVT